MVSPTLIFRVLHVLHPFDCQGVPPMSVQEEYLEGATD